MRSFWIAAVLLMLVAPAWAGPTGEPDPALRQALIKAINESSSFDDRFNAEVWLSDMSTRLKPLMPDDAERLRFLRLLHGEAIHAKLAPEFVLAVIQVESRFDRFAISKSGALGYMQIMPFWLKEIGKPGDSLFDPQTNLRMGCTILKYYLDMEHGDMVRTLARYNGSIGRTEYPARVIRALTQRWYQG
ncbi:MAG TPA: lytic transglycosylase domain-containing protein [Stenotrophobium sp.]|jgi:soluble lytic murein transglycosylase-like protein|nr:lytic transglycosylase domain-containing protein [Stenotrophobium sp.]